MKLVEIISREIAAMEGRDYDRLEHWKKLSYKVRAKEMVEVLKRIKARRMKNDNKNI